MAIVAQTMSIGSTIVVGISSGLGISISRPLAIVSQAMVSKTVATIVTQTMSKVSTIVVGISISISRPLAIVSQAMVSKTVATIVAQTMSIVSIVVGISSRLGISISRPLAIAIESIAIAESIVSNAIAIAQTMAIEQEGI